MDSETDVRIAELGYELPAVSAPLASYTAFVRTGNLVFLSGHIPFKEDMTTLHAGKVGVDYTTAQAAAVAESIGLGLISTLKANLKDLDRVVRIVKVVGFVNAPHWYTEHPEVLNGCSDLLHSVFEERGLHARSAVGASSLPRDVPVEIELVAEVEEGEYPIDAHRKYYEERHVTMPPMTPQEVKKSRFSQMWRPPSLCVFPYVSGFILSYRWRSSRVSRRRAVTDRETPLNGSHCGGNDSKTGGSSHRCASRSKSLSTMSKSLSTHSSHICQALFFPHMTETPFLPTCHRM